jgi:hypothetical protein
VAIDETQVIQAFASFGEGGGIEDEAVAPGVLGPLPPPPEELRRQRAQKLYYRLACKEKTHRLMDL